MSKKNNSKSCSDNIYSNHDELGILITTFNATIEKFTKDSNGKHAILFVDPEGRALTVKGDEVISDNWIAIDYWDHDLLNPFLTISGDNYVKVYKLINVKEYAYNGKPVLRIQVEKLEQATGAAAKKATNYSRVKKGDRVSITFAGNKENEEQEDKKTIAKLVEKKNDLSTLENALEAADLYSTLDDGSQWYTVFAPTNNAFNDLPAGTLVGLLKKKNKAKLQELLKDHVVEGKFTAKELSKKSSVRTLSGKKLKVLKSGSNLMVGGVTVQDADIEASNGVVHTIKDVIL